MKIKIEDEVNISPFVLGDSIVFDSDMLEFSKGLLKDDKGSMGIRFIIQLNKALYRADYESLPTEDIEFIEAIQAAVDNYKKDEDNE